MRKCATHCNTLQHTATHCNTLQHTATHCNTLQHTAEMKRLSLYNTLRHTAPHCNALQHTATLFRHAVRVPRGSLGNALDWKCECRNETPLARQHTATYRNTLQPTATHCNTLQPTATHCNTLQHTATHLRHAVRVPRDSLGNAWYWKCKCGNETSLLHAHRRARRHSIQSVYQGFRCVFTWLFGVFTWLFGVFTGLFCVFTGLFCAFTLHLYKSFHIYKVCIQNKCVLERTGLFVALIRV